MPCRLGSFAFEPTARSSARCWRRPRSPRRCALAGLQHRRRLPDADARDEAPLADEMIALTRAQGHGRRNPRSWSASSRKNRSSRSGSRTRPASFALLKTYPICRWSGELGPKVKEGDRQAPEGFYTITPGQMNPNSNYYLVVQHRLPERLRPRLGPHRRLPDGPWRLLVARLLRHDRRADRRDLRAGARRLLRRPEGVPGPGLSVPHDGGEHGAAPQQPEHPVLEDAQAGQRPFRGDAPGAQGRRLRASTTCSTPSAATDNR